MTNLSGTNLNNGAAVGPQGEGRESPSNFPTYPVYKNSGVEWLGDVPEHWGVKQLRYLGRFRKGLTITKADLADTGIPCLNYGEVHSLYSFEVNQDIQPLKSVPAEYMKAEPSACVKYGDFVFADTSEDLDGVGNFTHVSGMEPLFAGYHTIIYSLDSEVSSRFLAYCLDSFAFRTQLRLGVKGVKVFSVTQEILRGGTAWLPTTAEQTQIARFLDHETARIDALIEEQQRLIELLKEKRQAVISHAVTKGLDPTVPMKDSGVEWLGEVPAHWEVIAIKWLSPVLRGASPRPIDDPKYFDESGEYAWVRIADVSASDGTLRETTQTLSALGASLSVKMEPGEMFLSIAGTVGKPCITQIKACIHDGFVYFPSLSIDNKFLYRIFEVGTCYGGLGKMGTQLNLNTETVGGIQIGVPPSSEIAHILEFIDRQSSAFDSLIEEAAKGVDLLQERRSALISAAVTGKIDVRGWQPPVSTQAPEPAVAEAV